MKQLFYMFMILALANINPVYGQVDYNSEVQTIFTSRCVSCHGGTSGVTLDTYDAVMSSVGNQYGSLIVVPFDADDSPLFDKINPNPQFGGMMPQGGSLTDEQRETIRLWIEEGATEFPATSINPNDETPLVFELIGNYPNPFNPSTTIRYALAEPANVLIEVYNINGQKVSVLDESNRSAGYHTAVFNASNLTSGVYLYRLIANGSNTQFTQTRKFTLLR